MAMEQTLGVQLMWPVAAAEASDSKYGSIEPAHVFCALLKFVEFEDDFFRTVAKSAQIAKVMVAERDELRAHLQTRELPTPTATSGLRHALRAAHGTGGAGRRKPENLRPSREADAVCEAAEASAKASGESAVGGAHLLTALCDCSDAAIAAALETVGINPRASGQRTPLLDTYGSDLSVLVKGKKFSSPDPSDAVCRVLRDELLKHATPNIVLIEAGERSANEAVRMLAADLSKNPGAGLRIVELSIQQVVEGVKTGDELESRLWGLLQEAAQTRGVVLLLSDFHRFIAVGEEVVTRVCRTGLAAEGIRAIATTNDRAYASHISSVDGIGDLFHDVWMHDLEPPVRV
jgi:ATP-dependent Clp protease ATP-binding subunit ClpA